METRGRPNVPIEIKRLKGTLRADRLPTGIALSGLVSALEPPNPPEGLLDTGAAFWGLAWRSSWISQTSDYLLVAIVSQSLDERDFLRQLVSEQPENFRARAGLRELEKQLVSNLGLLGFSPSDRSRLGLVEIKKESKLDELMRRKQERDKELERARNI